ncbi:MAG: UvrD-helicase domain-containing protein [Planctomycetes bacterium]|nr:UvrD-helicase domain-containing protein [Planctomycetota bacterium]
MDNTNNFIEEKQNLELTIEHIDNRVKDLESRPIERGAADRESELKQRRHRMDDITTLKMARSDPYFGRIDFAYDDSPTKVETFYIGRHFIEVDYVYSRWAPIAQLFYRPLQGKYVRKDGREFTGKVHLKRELTIDRARLLQLVDVYKLLPPSGEVQGAASPKLIRTLARYREGGLEDIIETIQPQQYEFIASRPEHIMIIQGVAGSGKSEIGLHRLSYLLSPDNELGLNIKPERVIFFAPSKIFLGYVSKLIPGLELNGILQTTAPRWMLRNFTMRPNIVLEDGIQNKLLSQTTKDHSDYIHVARFKGSLLMIDVVDKYLRLKQSGIAQNAVAMTYKGVTVVSKKDMKTIVRKSRGRPLNIRREFAMSQIHTKIKHGLPVRIGPKLVESLESQLDTFWPRLDYREVYREILVDYNFLNSATKGAISLKEALLVSQQMSASGKRFQREDLAALLLLDSVLNWQKRVSYDHIVVDEAQDFSPLELFMISKFSRNDSLTILGDTAQAILPHRGITGWKELNKVFGRRGIYRGDARISYRSTTEITRYANRLLKKVDSKLRQAIPYERHGEAPKFIRSKSHKLMVEAIYKDVLELSRKEVKTIVLITKTRKDARNLHISLKAHGADDIGIVSNNSSALGRVSIAPISLVKGLEWDAVIIAGARAMNYPFSDFHNRLLYLAVTRAVHHLHIHWYGQLAEILEAKSLMRSLNKRTRRRKNRDSWTRHTKISD